MNIIRYRRPHLTSWAPMNRLSSLHQEVSRLFDRTHTNDVTTPGYSGHWSPALDVFQDKDHVYVNVELPGLKKEEIDIALEDGVLSISGERKKQTDVGETENGFRSERYFGGFRRTVVLPAPVDATQVTAIYRDGILSVELPKSEAAKPRKIEVTVS